MSTIHIDEATGSDTTGQGTEAQPYQSLAFAIFTTADAKYLIRKDANTSYDEPTQSAIKKGKKGADGLEKKRKKAEELAEREAKEKGEEREKRERLLEESKSIVLTEDTSLAKAIKVFNNYFFILNVVYHELCSRQRYHNLLNIDLNEFVYSAGSTVYDNRKTSPLLLYAMVQDIFKLFFQAAS